MIKTTVSNGQPVTYSPEGGNSPVVTFLHGFCEDSRMWKDFIPSKNTRSWRALTINLPGFGGSGMPEQLSIRKMAEAVKSVWQAENIKKSILVGHSMGGYVGLEVLAGFPEYLLGLSLFHSHPYADAEEVKQRRNRANEFVLKHGSPTFAHQMFNGFFDDAFNDKDSILSLIKHWMESTPPENVAAANTAMKNRKDHCPTLVNAQIPIQFIIGKTDIAVPAGKAVEQTILPKIADIHILENTGHMGMFERKEETFTMINNFVDICTSLQR